MLIVLQFIVVAMLTYSTHKAQHLIKPGPTHTQIIVYCADLPRVQCRHLTNKNTMSVQ